MRYAHLRNLVKASSPSVNRFFRAALRGSVWETESMVTPVFATPILTTSWLA